MRRWGKTTARWCDQWCDANANCDRCEQWRDANVSAVATSTRDVDYSGQDLQTRWGELNRQQLEGKRNWRNRKPKTLNHVSKSCQITSKRCRFRFIFSPIQTRTHVPNSRFCAIQTSLLPIKLILHQKWVFFWVNSEAMSRIANSSELTHEFHNQAHNYASLTAFASTFALV